MTLFSPTHQKGDLILTLLENEGGYLPHSSKRVYPGTAEVWVNPPRSAIFDGLTVLNVRGRFGYLKIIIYASVKLLGDTRVLPGQSGPGPGFTRSRPGLYPVDPGDHRKQYRRVVYVV